MLLLILNTSHYTLYFGVSRLEIYLAISAIVLVIIGFYTGYRFFGKKDVIKGTKSILVVKGENNTIGLSKRELEVLELMAKGHTNQEIADLLFVSLATIKSHASNIYDKMDVKRRTQAVQRGLDLGLVTHTTLV